MSVTLGVLLGIAGLFVLALLGLFLFSPGRPRPPKPSARNPGAKGVCRVEKPVIGGVAQAVVVRGRDESLPLLLAVHGGPGEPLTPMMDRFESLEERFIVCYWEQRGAGKSYAKHIVPDSMNIGQFVRDTLEVTRFLLSAFGRRKLYILGVSWGSLLSVLAVRESPGLYAAYLGTGQITNQLRSEQQAYDIVLERARRAGDAKAVRALTRVGRPPFPPEETLRRLLTERKYFRKYTDPSVRKTGMARFLLGLMLSPAYTVADKINYFKGMKEGVRLFPEVMKLDLAASAPELAVPVYVFQGKHDLQTLAPLAEQFIRDLKAPQKEFHLFENAAHMPLAEETERFIERLDKIEELRAPWFA